MTMSFFLVECELCLQEVEIIVILPDPVPMISDVVGKSFLYVPQMVDIGVVRVKDRIAPCEREHPHAFLVGIGGVDEHAHPFVGSIVTRFCAARLPDA